MSTATLYGHERRIVPTSVLWVGVACGLAALWLGVGILHAAPDHHHAYAAGIPRKPEEVTAWILCVTGGMVAFFNAADACRRIYMGWKHPRRRGSRKPKRAKADDAPEKPRPAQ